MDRTLTEKMLEQVKVIADAAKRIADELEAAPPKGVIARPGMVLIGDSGTRYLVTTENMYRRASGRFSGGTPVVDERGEWGRAKTPLYRTLSGEPIIGYEDD